MNRTRSILVGACLLLLCATLGICEEQSWSLASLNPFQKTSSTTRTPAKPKPSARKAQPSTWDKLTSGTKNAFTKTNETINPWAKKTAPASKRASTKQTANRPKAAEKKSFLSGLWSAPEEPKRPQTVNEFLAQPRPK